MNDSVIVNQVYLIYDRPYFVVDSNDCIRLILVIHNIAFVN